MKAIHYVLMGLLVVGLTVSCASQDGSAPVDVVREWTDGLKATDFAKMANLMHPDALVEFREILMPVMQGFQQSIAKDTAAISQVPDSLKQKLNGIELLEPQPFYVQSMGVLAAIVPDLTASLSGMTSTVIGGVPEGDSLVHVVTRTKVSYMGREVSNDMDVVSVKKADGGWKVMLTGGMRGLASGIRQAFEGMG